MSKHPEECTHRSSFCQLARLFSGQHLIIRKMVAPELWEIHILSSHLILHAHFLD